MKLKKKYTNSEDTSVKEFPADMKEENRTIQSTGKPIKFKIYSPQKKFEEEKGKKKCEKSKHKRNTDLESNEKSLDDSHEEKTSSHKRRRKVLTTDPVHYKPGMLSDLLQKKKYGCLILPWEKGFGENEGQPPSIKMNEDGAEQKAKVKINPLFDMSRRSEGNVVSKSSTTYTVFIGNLPQDVTLSQVKRIFKRLRRNISKIKIKSKELKKNKVLPRSSHNVNIKGQCTSAIVKFSSEESYEAALNMNGKLCNGHHLRITGAQDETKCDAEKSVFVGNLTTGMSDDDLWKTFENCGGIDSVRVIKDKLNNKGYFGYVNFKSAESVNEALKLDGTSVLNRQIRVNRFNKNIFSLSDSITVKRNKKKQTKPRLNCDDGIVDTSDVNTLEGKKKKSRKSPKINTASIDAEFGVPAKKKKKKKKLSHDKKTSEIE